MIFRNEGSNLFMIRAFLLGIHAQLITHFWSPQTKRPSRGGDGRFDLRRRVLYRVFEELPLFILEAFFFGLPLLLPEQWEPLL
jgi:hypothetical protein